MTAGDLHDILMEDGAELMVKTIKAMANNEITLLSKMIVKVVTLQCLIRRCPLQWNQPAVNIVNLVRGLNPWPVAICKYKDKAMKVFLAEVG